MAPLLVYHGCRSSWRVALLGQVAFPSEAAHLPTVEAWKVAGGKLLWWPDDSLLRWQGRGIVELLLLRLLSLLELSWLKLWVMAPVLLLLWSTQLTPRWGIHHTVLQRSTARTTTACRSRHQLLPIFLIGLINGLHHPLLVNGRTCQLIVRQAREMHQVLLQVDREPCAVQVGLLLIRVDVVCAILSQGVELPCVVEYTAVPLLKV
jgi:hypothetical protein